MWMHAAEQMLCVIRDAGSRQSKAIGIPYPVSRTPHRDGTSGSPVTADIAFKKKRKEEI